jgi:DHA2 family methylenomycin A resistance protein-like MFS transporter
VCARDVSAAAEVFGGEDRECARAARQTGTAAGVAIFGAVAGSPDDATRFTSAVHGLALGATALWLIAFAVALVGIEHGTATQDR